MHELTLVLIPGLVSDARVWQPVADALKDSYVIHAANVQRDDRIEAMAARLLADADGPLIAVGHSMGGRVAMEMARQAPDRLRALVLANTGHDTRKPGETAKRQAKIDLGHDSMAKLAAEWLPGMLDPARTSDTALIEGLTEMVIAAGPAVHERQIHALLNRPDAGACLGRIACPILLLTGRQDAWSPAAQHRAIADMAPDAEVQLIDDAGHFMPVEQPADTVARITEWLSRNKERTHV
ncbi:alpha/beta fold hydrolase [Roseinatronobacter alkalisoli]|uniref:Alpha/beta fold hydrolase n=1 Tax=Roseinatronobacter alkalisoli TaxID=3028235 RepID=A0ABT5TC28_9RHOB|nr:alpha/beta fold hydrolase [Roseinatronobacter sp. HJB301]MDD7972688.1 alpha/beta fold hydrolase [Roseinatronobacter sp. HJB301]